MILPIQCFVNEIKFIAEVNEHSQVFRQPEVDVVLNWFDENFVPIFPQKSSLKHSGHQLQLNNYHIHGNAIKPADYFIDLGVICLPDSSYVAHYQGFITKARKAVGLLHRTFHPRTQQLMRQAIQAYITSILMYGRPFKLI